MDDRYKVSHNEVIFDKMEQEFLNLEETCTRLNNYENNLSTIINFLGDIRNKINED